MRIKVGAQKMDGVHCTSIQEALDSVKDPGEKNVEIVLAKGIYRLEKPIELSADYSFDSLTIMGEDREETILCGSLLIQGEWKPYFNNIYYCDVEWGREIDMLYVNGKQYHMARYPKYNENERILQGYAGDCISKERASRWSNPQGGYFHVMHVHRWGDFHYRLTGKDPEGNVIMEGGWQNNRRIGIHEEFRYVENIFEELTAEGEWYYHKEEGKLFVIFEKDVSIDGAVAEAVMNDRLIRVTGTEEELVENVKIKDLTFTHTKRTFMNVKEPMLRSDWCIVRDGALYFENTANVVVENCNLINMGSNAVCVNGKNTGFAMRSSLIRDIAGNGICFIGKTDCVRSPLFEYHERLDIKELDMIKGPKSDNYPVDCSVEDCLITRTGRVEKQTAAVQVSMSRGVRVSSCSIYDVPRAAINFSEGSWGGHIIENCDIFDTVLETGDHGAFNSWGRDRYWGLKGIEINSLKEIDMMHLPYLDAVDTNYIRNNRIRCDYGWDIDLDDGSTNYEIYNNLCLKGGIKLREGFGRKVYNNITLNNSLHPHVWFKNSGDTIMHNIFFGKYKPIKMTFDWGNEVDDNIVHDQKSGMEPVPAVILQKDSCKDDKSILCDCCFKDPIYGDFTVQNPKVLETGYKNFDIKNFGVKSERLNLLAKSPQIPPVRTLIIALGHDEDYFEHSEVVYKNITSLEEASAYGAGSKDGVTADGVIVSELSPFYKLTLKGLAEGDVILEINDIAVDNIHDLKKMSGFLEKPFEVKFKILRSQKEMLL